MASDALPLIGPAPESNDMVSPTTTTTTPLFTPPPPPPPPIPDPTVLSDGPAGGCHQAAFVMTEVGRQQGLLVMISINRFPTQPTNASVGGTVGVAGLGGGGGGGQGLVWGGGGWGGKCDMLHSVREETKWKTLILEDCCVGSIWTPLIVRERGGGGGETQRE